MYDNFTKTLQKKSVKSQENREMFINKFWPLKKKLLSIGKKTE